MPVHETKMSDETSGCPCDACRFSSNCVGECDSFTRYTKEVSPVKRELLLIEFIKLQKVSYENQTL